MRRTYLLAATALAVSLAVSRPARAELPVIDVATQFVNRLISQAEQALWKQLSDLNIDTLTRGFTQLSNYLQGQVASAVQIADASNTANATFQRQVRNAQIVSDHAVSPASCLALDGGQSVTLASAQADRVTIILSSVADTRGEGGPGSPAYGGTAQAAEANRELHLTRYCSQVDVEAGLCGSVSERENADQRAASLFGPATYRAQADIDAANDYTMSLIQPTPPAPLRGDARKGLDGAQAEQRRKAYNARISLSRLITNTITGLHAAAVVLTPEQQAQQTLMGRTPTTNGSAYDAMELEVYRRHGNQNWNVSLERMPGAPTLLRELSRQLAFLTAVVWTDTKLQMQGNVALAALLAADAERDLRNNQTPVMPTPLIGSR